MTNIYIILEVLIIMKKIFEVNFWNWQKGSNWDGEITAPFICISLLDFQWKEQLPAA